MKQFYYLPFVLLFVFSLTLIGCGNKNPKDKEDPISHGRELEYERDVTFLNNEGNEITNIRVAVADEPEERNEGLMDVTNLPTDAGMIFLFPDERERSFYMANTPLSLDIIFVNADSTIVRIHHNTNPFNSNQLVSGEPAKYVVETNGGYCISHDIQEGMKVRF